ncbi:hypothetical protein JCM9279_006127 [Rhodotorula babjevae]
MVQPPSAFSSPETAHSALFPTDSRPTTSPSSSASSCAPPTLDRRKINDKIYLASSPGRQVGLFAARTLVPGERILVEAPLVVVNSAHDVAFAVDSLASQQKKAFYELANAYEDEPTTSSERGVFDTNAFFLGSRSSPSSSVPSSSSGIDAKHGIFTLSSRFNHSCTPNVKTSFSPSLARLVTHVLRPIATDDELLTSYLGGPALFASTSAERTARLQRAWAFECYCAVCASGNAARTPSDARRAELAQLYERRPGVRLRERDAPRGGGGGEIERVLRDAARSVRLLEDEGLAVDGVEAFCLPAARACAWHGDLKAARVWAERGWESARRAYGEGAEVERVLRAARDRPHELVLGGRAGEKRELLRLTRELLRPSCFNSLSSSSASASSRGPRAATSERGWLGRLFRSIY